jgi:hypothetical protein
MTDLPAVPPPQPRDYPFFDGIGAVYRQRIDELYEAKIQADTRSGLVSKATPIITKVAVGLAGLALTGIIALGAWLWLQFHGINETLSAAAAGVVVPVGTVVGWSAPVPDRPDRELRVGDWHFHWHECDGAEIFLDKHTQLGDLIRDIYGKATPGRVRLPDYRGMFLRGAGTVVQPNVEGRILPKYAPKGLGEQQLSSVSPIDMFFRDSGAEANPLLYPRYDGSIQGSKGGESYADLRLHPAKDIGGHHMATETVPINYAVHWIIRVR